MRGGEAGPERGYIEAQPKMAEPIIKLTLAPIQTVVMIAALMQELAIAEKKLFATEGSKRDLMACKKALEEEVALKEAATQKVAITCLRRSKLVHVPGWLCRW